MEQKKGVVALVLLRLCMGFMLFWAFLDKVFGLGFATTPDKSWLAGVSPTEGFLKFAAKGPLVTFFQSLAGSGVVDWLYMMGLLLIGLALILGIGMRIAGYTGALLMILLWSSLLFPKNNPILDEHIIYLFVFLLLPSLKAGAHFGFGRWWTKTKLVQKWPILE